GSTYQEYQLFHATIEPLLNELGKSFRRILFSGFVQEDKVIGGIYFLKDQTAFPGFLLLHTKALRVLQVWYDLKFKFIIMAQSFNIVVNEALKAAFISFSYEEQFNVHCIILAFTS